MYFSKHGINHGKKITSYPAIKEKLDGNYQYCTDDVVVDGNMVRGNRHVVQVINTHFMRGQRPYLIAVNYAEFRGTAKLGNA